MHTIGDSPATNSCQKCEDMVLLDGCPPLCVFGVRFGLFCEGQKGCQQAPANGPCGQEISDDDARGCLLVCWLDLRSKDTHSPHDTTHTQTGSTYDGRWCGRRGWQWRLGAFCSCRPSDGRSATGKSDDDDDPHQSSVIRAFAAYMHQPSESQHATSSGLHA